MKRKGFIQISLLFILAFVLLAAACQNRSINLEIKDEVAQYLRAQSDSMTLASLEKVDGYPMYVMAYYGDYGFSDYLETGISRAASLDASYRHSNNGLMCTCFAAIAVKDSCIFGRSFGWSNPSPLLFLFTHPPDGYASVSMVYLGNFGYNENNLPDSKDNRENLLGAPYVPYDGLNEMGVAIGMMAVPEAKAPFDPAKVTIGEIQLIRLVLDYAKDLNEAIALIQDYNIEMQTPPIHFLIADASGHSAVVEFVGGKMVVIRNNEPWQVSTNFIIQGTRAPEFVSCVRYNRAYQSLKNKGGKISKEYAMGVLNQVQQDITRWSTVYCMNTGEISIAVGNKYDVVRKFNLKMNGMPELHQILFLNPIDS